MAPPGRTPALIIIGLIVVFGIIHLGTGIGIVARYRQYQDVFRPSVGLAAFNIVIAIYALAVAILCLMGVLQERPALTKTAAICVGVLGILAMASLIATLVINSQSVSYVRSRLSYRVNSYIETQSSITIVDRIQTNYQCCGENSWLDWQHAGLGTTSTGTGVNTGVVTGGNTGITTGTNTGTNTGTSNGVVVGGRRRRHASLLWSPLVHAVRRRRQTVILPTNSFNLPLSCCTNGGSSVGNTVGGFCTYGGGNGTTNFYVQGCIAPVADVLVLQITGIAIINICLAILSFVLLPVLMRMFPAAFDPTNPNNKLPLPYQTQQEQQFPNGGYYVTNPDPNAYYSYPAQPIYMTYQ